MLDQLPMETRFQVETFERSVDQMNLDQAKDMLIKVNRLMVAKEHTYRLMLKGELPTRI